MKCKKILTALLAAACTMSGCHGDLDIMQDNKLSASNMWIDESDAETATYGIYLYMRDALKSVHDIYLCWGEFRNGLWGAGTNKTLSGVDQTQVRTSTMSSSNAYADWSVMYKTVNQANLILKHVPEMGISESVRNFSLGNAYFSRAWCYFWIARIWGDAPLALTGYESTAGDLYLPRAPKAEIFARIESDLTEAERTQKAHDELKKYPIVQSADIEVIQSGLLYRKDYDLGDKCDVVCHRLGKSFAARITGVNEVFKAGQHSVSLTFGESASTVYQRVARHGRGDVRGYELPQITSRRVRILMPGNDWQTATINSPKTGV